MKRNLFKKLAAAAGAAVMALTLVMPMGAVRAAGTITSDSPVSLTITKYAGENVNTGLDNNTLTGTEADAPSGFKTLANVEFTAIKIATIDQVSDTNGNNSVKYTLTSAAQPLGIGSINEQKTGNEIDTWRSQNAATANAISNETLKSITTGKTTATTGSDGKVVFSSNEDAEHKIDGQGLYLVVETNAPSTVTKRSVPFIVSLPMTSKVNESEWVYNVYAYPKNSTSDTDVEKTITKINDNGSDSGIADGGATAEAQIGDEITYKVKTTALVPDAGLTDLYIKDTMSKGLTFVQSPKLSDSDVSVYKGSIDESNKLTPTTNYTVSVTPGDNSTTILTVKFSNDYLSTLNNDQSTRTHDFYFVYKAQLNKDAVLGTIGNTNEVHMYYNYNNGPEVDIDGGYEDTKVYTWGIDLTKTGDDGSKLDGVVFTLSQDNTNLEFVYDSSINAYRKVVSGEESARADLSTQSGGKLYIRGLDSGTYTLTETKTKDGYTLLKSPITIVINGNKTNGSAIATVDGKQVSMNNDNIEGNDGSNSALIPITVVNNKGFDLPQTGAAGTAIFAIAGIVLVAVAGALLIFRRKTQK